MIATVSEVVEVIAFLTSAMSGMTGQLPHVDCGIV
jgi:enoyl-[acyl-carrier-protein] reductase (NADH)